MSCWTCCCMSVLLTIRFRKYKKYKTTMICVMQVTKWILLLVRILWITHNPSDPRLWNRWFFSFHFSYISSIFNPNVQANWPLSRKYFLFDVNNCYIGSTWMDKLCPGIFQNCKNEVQVLLLCVLEPIGLWHKK